MSLCTYLPRAPTHTSLIRYFIVGHKSPDLWGKKASAGASYLKDNLLTLRLVYNTSRDTESFIEKVRMLRCLLDGISR